MYSVAELQILAGAFLKATGWTEGQLGAAILNRKFITGLLDGRDVMASSAELASYWFERNWPEGVAWPKKVRRCDLTKTLTKTAADATKEGAAAT